MAEKNNTDLDEFFDEKGKHLEEVIAKNNEEMAKILNKRDPRITSVVEDVYKDFFGADFVQKYNHDKNASGSDALKNAITNALNDDLPSAPVYEHTEFGYGEKGDGATAVSDTPGQPKETAEAVAQTVEEPEKSGMEELQELIGLTAVKEDVKERGNLMKVQKRREEKGLKFVPTSLHLVFTGNPGTGKTTVARILARLYKEIGVLSKGQLIEVDRSGLVAGYVGQTALKTQDKIQQALGGILFIDEAYALAKEGNDFGQEAIDTILKAMEDHRKDLIVIVAGYTKPMEEFINSNPGLRSRFNKYVFFPDYTAEELIGIFKLNCKKYSYQMSPEAEKAVSDLLTSRAEEKGENFANAREARNLFEEIITNQATRVAQIPDPDEETLTTILPEDLP